MLISLLCRDNRFHDAHNARETHGEESKPKHPIKSPYKSHMNLPPERGNRLMFHDTVGHFQKQDFFLVQRRVEREIKRTGHGRKESPPVERSPARAAVLMLLHAEH